MLVCLSWKIAAERVASQFYYQIYEQAIQDRIKQYYNKYINKMQTGMRCRRSIRPHDKENLQNNHNYHSIQSIQKENQLSSSTEQPSLLLNALSENKQTDSPSPVINQPTSYSQLTTQFHTQDQIYTNTTAYIHTYNEELTANALNLQKLGPFLSKHNIIPSLRARMLDWMTEVTCSYRFQPKTYFDGVQFLDKYFKFQQEPIEPQELHPLGIAAMLLASKANQIYPLRIGIAYDKIAHRKISITNLSSAQADIMKSLNYKLNEWTFYDIASSCLTTFNNELLLPVLQYISRLVVIDYDFYITLTPALIGEAVAWVSLQICDEKEPEWMKSKAQVHECGNQVLNLINTFKTAYPSLRNTDRFSQCEIIEKVETYMKHSRNC